MIRKLTALLVGGAIVSMQPLAALSQTPSSPPSQPSQWYGPGPWWMWGDGFGWQFWWICPLMMVFMIAAFAVIFIAVRRELPWHGGHAALQILNERLARGEIHRDEYEEKKAAILSGGGR